MIEWGKAYRGLYRQENGIVWRGPADNEVTFFSDDGDHHHFGFDDRDFFELSIGEEVYVSPERNPNWIPKSIHNPNNKDKITWFEKLFKIKR